MCVFMHAHEFARECKPESGGLEARNPACTGARRPKEDRNTGGKVGETGIGRQHSWLQEMLQAALGGEAEAF